MVKKAAFLKLTVAMAIFGTVGIFVKNIPLSASLIALTRAIIGFAFLAFVMILGKKKVHLSAIRRNLALLLVSGLFIGFNWILLFESYRYTSVAVSTLCYYMAPMIVIVASPFVLKEKLTLKKGICVLVALVGMLFISGVLREDMSSGSHLKGILLGIGAAVLYATIMLLNQKLTGINAYERTAFQLGMAGLVLVPYCLLTCDFSTIELTAQPILLLLVVGVFHTGFTYYLYFGSMEFLSGQTVAMISYLDPIIAVLLSVFLLKEPLHPLDIPGALLILGAALVSELKPGERKSK
jgi:RarD protein